MVTVQEYIAADGRNHYREWFVDLKGEAARKAATAVYRMAAGNTAGLKSIGAGLAEWRIHWGPGIRIYVHQDGEELIVLMGGSVKGNQGTEIKEAARLVEEYRQRKKGLTAARKIRR
jgi:putative addiction module killer protein